MKLKDLAEQTGLAVNNLSILKTNKARAIRFSTLEALCKVLQCTPGDLIEYVSDDQEAPAAVGRERIGQAGEMQ